MEIASISKKISDVLKKYRYAVLVLVIGLVLIIIPTVNEKETNEVTQMVEPVKNVSIQEELTALLSKIDGAGSVEIMLTVAEGEEIIYQENMDSSDDDDSSDINIDTVIVTDAQKNQTGLVRKVNPPKYLGALIVCQGADDPVVRLAIVDAVSKITGLGTNCISVLKMK